jgi:PIG-X / PBN1
LDAIFPRETVFYHAKHSHDPLTMLVPVADTTNAIFIQTLTILTILTGFTYLLYLGTISTSKALSRLHKGKQKSKVQ